MIELNSVYLRTFPPFIVTLATFIDESYKNCNLYCVSSNLVHSYNFYSIKCHLQLQFALDISLYIWSTSVSTLSMVTVARAQSLLLVSSEPRGSGSGAIKLW